MKFISNQEEDAVTTSAIDAKLLAEMFFAGAANLEANKEWINELNVFPVPDGDTSNPPSKRFPPLEALTA